MKYLNAPTQTWMALGLMIILGLHSLDGCASALPNPIPAFRDVINSGSEPQTEDSIDIDTNLDLDEIHRRQLIDFPNREIKCNITLSPAFSKYTYYCPPLLSLPYYDFLMRYNCCQMPGDEPVCCAALIGDPTCPKVSCDFGSRVPVMVSDLDHTWLRPLDPEYYFSFLFLFFGLFSRQLQHKTLNTHTIFLVSFPIFFPTIWPSHGSTLVPQRPATYRPRSRANFLYRTPISLSMTLCNCYLLLIS
ncbi:hypothetical protein DFH27DRAFT_598756 [Peziza echinospora]|nr:hypothetical protein DFH27DRAFT_598756 [Peziza echinospora]